MKHLTNHNDSGQGGALKMYIYFQYRNACLLLVPGYLNVLSLSGIPEHPTTQSGAELLPHLAKEEMSAKVT